MITDEKPKLLIPIESFRKIMAYTQLAEGEITGFADVEYNVERENFVVGEVYLIEQTAQAAEVDMNEEQISKFMLSRIEQGATQMPRIWWHSHVDMAAFFSGTDTQTISEFKSDSYTISLVVNKKREMKANLNLWKPFIYSSAIDVEVMVEYVEIPDEIVEEVKAKVKDMESQTTVYDNNYWRNVKKKGNGEKKGEEEATLLRIEDNLDEYDVYEGMATGWIPNNVKEGFAWLKEERDNIWVSWDAKMQEYVFYHMAEQILYKDLNNQYQRWGMAKIKEQVKQAEGYAE